MKAFKTTGPALSCSVLSASVWLPSERLNPAENNVGFGPSFNMPECLSTLPYF